MLHEVLAANHDALVERCLAKADARFESAHSGVFIYGVPLFLEQVIDALEREAGGAAPPDADVLHAVPSASAIGMTAALHGVELLQHGYSIDQVVHHYGDVCQSVSDLAIERGRPFTVGEFRTLNRCLDDAIADAVLAFGDAVDSRKSYDAGVAAGHQRRLVDMATKAYSALKTGKLGLNGATGAVLGQVLTELGDLIDGKTARHPPA